MEDKGTIRAVRADRDAGLPGPIGESNLIFLIDYYFVQWAYPALSPECDSPDPLHQAQYFHHQQ